MGPCYYCGKKGERGSDLRQIGFYVDIEKMNISIKCDLKNLNGKDIQFGLCKECIALAFEEGANALRQMSDQDFKQNV